MNQENKYLKRLIEEWRLHGKIIIACDFDDTISPWKLATQEECDKVIGIIKEAQLVGIHLVIFTACNKDRYPEILNYCEWKGLRVDSINQNPVELPYGNQNKVYANIFIDDRAGLEESLEILKEAMYMQRAYLQSEKNYTEIG